MSATPTAIAVSAGIASWSFLEYLIHRWLGHDRRFRRTPFGVEHVRHHVEGAYFAPTWKKALAAAAVLLVAGAPLAAALGPARGFGFVGGLLACYGAYEWLHRREHTCAGVGPYGRWARRHHFHHHFVDGRVNHGVTSPLWDLIFMTYERPTRIKVPARLAMPWLIDAQGAVRAEFADAYELLTPKPR
jgi:sterol desaturase/sphingolipid hydroxylase (fatty acid hydroxylase superfamily)